MSDGSTIEWLAWPGYKSASWNPTRGCTRVSEGCRNCYAEVMAARFNKPGQWGHGLAEMRGGDHRWTGRVELDEAKLLLPLRWRAPRVIFVNSTSDLFHEKLPDEAIDRVFAAMALCPQHRFICLTKRAERMRAWVTRLSESDNALEEICDAAVAISGSPCAAHIIEDVCMPLPNVILGVSVEDRSTMYRIDDLRATPSAVRMISFEPLLEDLGEIDLTGISWCVVGGESGPGARPAHPDWARGIRDQCQAAGVPFFFKQWGNLLHHSHADGDQRGPVLLWNNPATGRQNTFYQIGKNRAGRLLDGREWTQFPEGVF